MPLARYFFFVGGVLLALLFVIGSYAPQPPVVTAANADSDKPLIRINSERKWPEAVVFDTSHPPVIAAPVVTAANVPAPEISANALVREAYAQFQPSGPKQVQPSAAKKMARLKPQTRRKVAQNRVGPPMVLAAQQPQPHFGFFGNSTW